MPNAFLLSKAVGRRAAVELNLPLMTRIAIAPLALDSRRGLGEIREEFTARGKELMANKEAHRDAEQLHRLLEISWEYTMEEYPEFATSVGYPGQNDRWTDISFEAIARRKETDKLDLELIKSIDRAKLPAKDAITYDLYRRNSEFSVEGHQFPFQLLQVNQMGGVQQNVAQVITSTTFRTTKDYEDFVARLNGVPALIDQTIALLEKGLEQKVTPPQVTLRDVPQQVLNQIVKDPAASPVLTPLKEMSALVPAADQSRLRQAATEAYTKKVGPAFQKLHDFLTRNIALAHGLRSVRTSCRMATRGMPTGRDSRRPTI